MVLAMNCQMLGKLLSDYGVLEQFVISSNNKKLKLHFHFGLKIIKP